MAQVRGLELAAISALSLHVENASEVAHGPPCPPAATVRPGIPPSPALLERLSQTQGQSVGPPLLEPFSALISGFSQNLDLTGAISACGPGAAEDAVGGVSRPGESWPPPVNIPTLISSPSVPPHGPVTHLLFSKCPVRVHVSESVLPIFPLAESILSPLYLASSCSPSKMHEAPMKTESPFSGLLQHTWTVALSAIHCACARFCLPH